jgi:sugar lactone lactonase YvrE
MRVRQGCSVMSRPTAVSDPVGLGEGPLWDVDRQRLLWVDLACNAVHEFDPAAGLDHARQFDVPVGVLAPAASGGFVLAGGMGFAACAWPSTGLSWLGTVDLGERMNDGGCDPAGRFLAGTLVQDGTRGAALYRLERGRVQLLLEDVSISNGIDWSPGGDTMYYVDTPLERVDAFDYDVVTGELTHRRTFADLRDVQGRPDGLTVDSSGGVWVAMARGGAAVRRFTPEGRPDHVLEMPVPNVTSLAFGGERLEDLYITTSQLRLDAEDLQRWPGAGCLFRAGGVGVAGRPANLYVS